MFRRMDGAPARDGKPVSFTWQGRKMTGRSGDTVAAALLAAGVLATRSHPVTKMPRAPFCMMGVCFDCLVEIDGVPNKQACQVRLADGMDVKLQVGPRK